MVFIWEFWGETKWEKAKILTRGCLLPLKNASAQEGWEALLCCLSSKGDEENPGNRRALKFATVLGNPENQFWITAQERVCWTRTPQEGVLQSPKQLRLLQRRKVHWVTLKNQWRKNFRGRVDWQGKGDQMIQIFWRFYRGQFLAIVTKNNKKQNWE